MIAEITEMKESACTSETERGVGLFGLFRDLEQFLISVNYFIFFRI